MKVPEVLSALHDNKVEVWVEGDRLRYRTRDGSLPAFLKGALTQHKEEIITLLRKQERKTQTTSPLSYGQEAMWVLNQAFPESYAYNVSFCARIRSNLDISSLESSFQALVDRHAALRTTYTLEEDKLFQVLHGGYEFRLQRVDASHYQEDELLEAVLKQSRQPYDLHRGPVFHATLFSHSRDYHMLLIAAHHIAVDGWSVWLILDELRTLYESRARGVPAALPRPSSQFVDFVQWQDHLLNGPEGERLWAYWRQQLGGELPILALPTDHPRLPFQHLRGESVVFACTPELTKSIKNIAKSEGVTLYTLLLAAFKVLLFRYSRQEDLLVGTYSSGRTKDEFSNVIGCCVNPVIIRTHPQGSIRFKEYLAEVRRVVLDALTHQDYPFGLLAKRLHPHRDLSFASLFQADFVLQKPHRYGEVGRAVSLYAGKGQSVDFGGLDFEHVYLPQQEGQLDLTLEMMEGDTSLLGCLKYNSDLFTQETINRMAEQFQVMLQGIVQDISCPLSHLPVLTTAEEQNLLLEWSGHRDRQSLSTEQCIHHLFEKQAQQIPHKVAVVVPGSENSRLELSYGALNEQANQVGHFLRKQGIGPGSVVGVCLERSADLIVGILGILKAGGAYLPLDELMPKERLAVMLADAGTSLVLTQRTMNQYLPSTNIPVVHLDIMRETIAEEPCENLNTDVTQDHLAYIIFTSGSTGRPKGVMVEHGNLMAAFVGWNTRYQLSLLTTHLQLANFSFDVFSGDLVRALCAGGRLVLCPRDMVMDFGPLYTLMKEEHVECAEFVPAVLRGLTEYLEKNRKTLHFMKLLVCGSDVWSKEEFRRVTQLLAPDARLINSYGLTETTIDSCYFEEQNSNWETEQVVPIGRPFPGTQIFILDQNLKPTPLGVPGEICIGGKGVARGYVQPDGFPYEKFMETTIGANFKGRIFRTGDLGKFLPDGTIQLLGRMDDQIKIRGFRIELGEIETVLGRHPSIQGVVVLSKTDTFGEICLVAYYVSIGKNDLTPEELRAFLQEVLPDYMVPHVFIPITSIPLTPNGKVNRTALPEPTWHEVGHFPAFEGPRGPIEKSLSEIVEQILNRPRVGIHDNFFELGGHSLHATQVVSRIREKFKIEFPIRAIFESPTIARLALKVGEAKSHHEATSTIPPIRPVSREKGIPLSYSQQRMWFLNQLSPDSTAYNMPCALRLQGVLNRTALEQSMEEMVRRHEAFRTTFPMDDGVPVQMIGNATPRKIPFVDLRLLSKEERVKEAQRLVAADARRAFDLSEGPLVRFLLIQLARHDHVFLVTMHHIISDQWSAGIMGREFTDLYNAKCLGQDPPPTVPPSIQYADFAEWQRQWLTGEVLEKQRSYWMSKLHKMPVLDLPLDHPRPNVESFRGATYAMNLSKGLLEKLKRLSLQEEVTLFMGLLAGFYTLIFRYTGQRDFGIGVPIANRNQLAVENLIGTFVNTLVLRADLSGGPTFRQLLGRVKEIALEAYANQDLPFDKVVESLRAERDSSRAPLVQVLFNLANAPAEKFELEGLEWEAFEFELEASQFDWGLTIDPDFSHKAYLQYNTDLFDASTVRRVLRQYRQILESAVQNPDCPVSQLPILNETERFECLVQWNNTKTEFPRKVGLTELIEQQVDRNPESPAIIFQEEQLSYFQLNQRANQLANFLRSVGVGSEVLVGICVERSVEMVVGLLGILKAGGAYVPLDPTYPKQRLGAMLDDSHAPVLLTQQHLVPILPDHSAKVICLDSDWKKISGEKDTNLSHTCNPQQLAYVIFTSGSTGRPKGVQIEQHSLVNFLWSMLRDPGCNSQDRLLSVTTLSFDIAGLELFLPLVVGGQVVIVNREATFDGFRLIEEIERHRPTLMQATPATWRMLIESGWSGSKTLTAFCGGEALSSDLASQLCAKTKVAWNMYGPTETTVWSSIWKIKEGQKVLVGKSIANTQMYILDHHREPVPIGVSGELYIGGEGVARGYLERQDLTEERFVQDPFSSDRKAKLYKTGDLAKFTADGNIQCLGRLDHQVKIRGFRVELGEIEAVLGQHPAIRQVVVTAREENPVERRLIAYFVPWEPAESQGAILRQYALQTLPQYMVPAAFVPLDNIPLMPNGKVDFHALPEPSMVAQSIPRSPIAPRNSLEFQIMAIWEQVLGVSGFGVQDNFFELGGHSLLAVQVFAQLEKIFKRRIPVAVLFQVPTVEQLADLLSKEDSTNLWSSLIAIQPRGNKRPLFLVPGAGGQVLMFGELSRLLGTQRPLYGLQPPGLDGKTRPFLHIEDIAAFYIQQIRNVQPSGPYLLGGTCTGGVVAFEMAQQLRKQNEDAELLIMETWHPRSIKSLGGPAPVALSPLVFFVKEALRYFRRIGHLAPSQWGGIVVKILIKVKEMFKEGDVFLGNRQLLDIDRMAKTTFKAVSRYSPKPYPGHVYNVMASQRILDPSIPDTRMVWGDLAKDGHTDGYVPAENSGRLFVHPHVKDLAKELSNFLNRIQDS